MREQEVCDLAKEKQTQGNVLVVLWQSLFCWASQPQLIIPVFFKSEFGLYRSLSRFPLFRRRFGLRSWLCLMARNLDSSFCFCACVGVGWLVSPTVAFCATSLFSLVLFAFLGSLLGPPGGRSGLGGPSPVCHPSLGWSRSKSSHTHTCPPFWL